MRCKYCKKDAVIRTEEGLRLCREHFLEFVVNRVRKAIKRYNMLFGGERVVVMVSGGKDSGVLLDTLSRIKDEYMISIKPVYINLGIENYSDISREMAIAQARKLGMDVEIYDLKKEDGFTIDEAARYLRIPACAACGIVKRHVMEVLSRKHGNAVVATGHNLTDMFVFLQKNILSGSVDMLARFSASLPGDSGFSKKIKPLVLVTERSTLMYAYFREIPYVTRQCPHGSGAVNTELRKALFYVERVFPVGPYNAVNMFLREITPRLNIPVQPLRNCSVCGLPAQNDPCSFCKLKIRLEKKRAVAEGL